MPFCEIYLGRGKRSLGRVRGQLAVYFWGHLAVFTCARPFWAVFCGLEAVYKHLFYVLRLLLFGILDLHEVGGHFGKVVRFMK